uniref:Uncharacterized protein n=1 Tax=Salvator merianae TaxID=96440 RepID=A0A8D0BXY9_SALMN
MSVVRIKGRGIMVTALGCFLTCSGPMEDNPDVGTEVAEVMLICPVIWFMLFIPLVLVTMDTLMFMLLLYMLVFACCPKCGGDCCENMLKDEVHLHVKIKMIKLFRHQTSMII